ncbi:EAL domain-containing protein [Spirulina subsalsa]|nr:EAL domain-containing protein [Spirulina subsalsa]
MDAIEVMMDRQQGVSQALESLESDESSQRSRLSYEFRTPLTSIQASLGLLSSGKILPQSDEGMRLLAIANKNLERLLRVLNILEADQGATVPMLSPHALERMRLELDLRNAIPTSETPNGSQEIHLVYQPIVCLTTQKIIGFEALLRWYHPQHHWISPTEFIPLAEEVGLIHQLGLWTLRSACWQLHHWQQQGWGKDLTMSVNLSTLQLLQADLAAQVAEICLTTGISPHSLRVEITESLTIQNFPLSLQVLQQLKQLGIQIYLDDFGTGYSSLSRLHELSVDVLKIDRSFVSQKQWELIRGIFQFATSLGLEVIVEGVETLEELNQLTALGGTKVQGYFFSRPLNAHQATQLLQDNSVNFHVSSAAIIVSNTEIKSGKAS